MVKRIKILAIILTLLMCVYDVHIYGINYGYEYGYGNYFSSGRFLFTIILLALLGIILFYYNEYFALALDIYGITTFVIDGWGWYYVNAIAIILAVLIIITSLLLCVFISMSLMKKKNENDNQIKQEFIELKKQIQLLQTNNSQMPTTEQQSTAVQNLSENKVIVKTKIIETKERETAASRKKGKLLTALATGLSAGFGGDATQNMLAGHTQASHNARNAKFETVVTFLVIYNDNTRETVDTIKNDEKYNEYIMYLE